jgi:hypothetical protein
VIRPVRALPGLAGLLLFLVCGCDYTSFRYQIDEPLQIAVSPGPASTALESVVSTGEGPLWTSCQEVNDEAVAALKQQVGTRGHDGCTHLQWFNYETKAWQGAPACRKEYGWIAGGVYSFWWQSATSVHVRTDARPRATLTALRATLPTAAQATPLVVGHAAPSSGALRTQQSAPILSVGASLPFPPGLEIGLALPTEHGDA